MFSLITYIFTVGLTFGYSVIAVGISVVLCRHRLF